MHTHTRGGIGLKIETHTQLRAGKKEGNKSVGRKKEECKLVDYHSKDKLYTHTHTNSLTFVVVLETFLHFIIPGLFHDFIKIKEPEKLSRPGILHCKFLSKFPGLT